MLRLENDKNVYQTTCQLIAVVQLGFQTGIVDHGNSLSQCFQ